MIVDLTAKKLQELPVAEILALKDKHPGMTGVNLCMSQLNTVGIYKLRALSSVFSGVEMVKANSADISLMSDQQFDAFVGIFKNVTKVDLSGNHLGLMSLERLEVLDDAFENEVTEVNLGFGVLGRMSVEALSTLLNPFINAIKVDLSGCDLGKMSKDQLAVVVKSFQKAKEISLAYNFHYRDAKVDVFAALPGAFSSVTNLNFSENHLYGMDVREIQNLGRLFPNVRNLAVKEGNFIYMGADKIQALGLAFGKLQGLSLGNVKYWSISPELLMNFWKAFSHAKVIDLKMNDAIPAECIDRLIEMGKGDKKLVTRVCGLHHRQEDMDALVKAHIESLQVHNEPALASRVGLLASEQREGVNTGPSFGGGGASKD